MDPISCEIEESRVSRLDDESQSVFLTQRSRNRFNNNRPGGCHESRNDLNLTRARTPGVRRCSRLVTESADRRTEVCDGIRNMDLLNLVETVAGPRARLTSLGSSTVSLAEDLIH